MHSSEALASSDFQDWRADASCTKAEVMPDIAVLDRLGVVIRDPFDGIGAATFVLSCVTAFYDEYRAESDDFYAYPDYFTFQSDGRSIDYRWFDIWTEHKNVETARTSESVLRVINDRGVTILLVPDGPTGAPDLDSVTRESFERRIDGCYLYAPDGQLDEPSFSIRQPRDPTWEWIQRIVDTTDDDYASLRREHECHAVENDAITQDFRRIDSEDALRYLPDET